LRTRRGDARRLDEDITAAIPHGAEVEVNPQIGVLTLVG
jgi:hypothetical protein